VQVCILALATNAVFVQLNHPLSVVRYSNHTPAFFVLTISHVTCWHPRRDKKCKRKKRPKPSDNKRIPDSLPHRTSSSKTHEQHSNVNLLSLTKYYMHFTFIHSSNGMENAPTKRTKPAVNNTISIVEQLDGMKTGQKNNRSVRRQDKQVSFTINVTAFDRLD
jgi:hypothetical protein